MAARRKTRFAILGLLSWKPMSGYDIKKLIEMGLQYFWQESYEQLYPTLEALVAEGLGGTQGRFDLWGQPAPLHNHGEGPAYVSRLVERADRSAQASQRAATQILPSQPPSHRGGAFG